MTESEARAAIIAEARTWLRTPYAHAQKLKGCGVDCLMIVIAVYQAVGLMPNDLQVPYYNKQFNLHRGDETYLAGLLKYSREVEMPQPGDIALWQFGRKYAHSAIVVDWPTVIHAAQATGVIMEDISHNGGLIKIGNGPRPCKFLSYW